MQEKSIYKSIYMVDSSTKEYDNYIKEKYPFKYPKKDIISPFILVLILLFIILSFWIIYLVAGVAILCVALFWYKRRYLQAKHIDYLSHLERIIKADSKMKNISPVYPIYQSYDNNEKTLSIYYRDNISLYCKYEDIKEYKLYIDNLEIKHNRFSLTMGNAKTYKIRIIFNDNNGYELGLSNINKNIRMYKGYKFLQSVNLKTINDLCADIDKIQKKNRISD